MFADVVEIKVQAGKGGDGLFSFRREKYVDKGGPDGGDGGRGGNVLVQAEPNLNSLAAYRNLPVIKAEGGENGKRQRQHGKNGQDVVIKVPPGTVVWEADKQLADVRAGSSVVVAAGGRGGFGNAHFTSSVRQAPRVAELGEPGEHKLLKLELKLIADVGLIGLPNAGKSTLLSVISNAKPKIANYPFTTKEPNLGVADIDGSSILVADIPGLIEGASRGRGLGHTFLRHVERTAVLVHLVDATQDGVGKAYASVNKELASYGAGLSNKPQLVVLSKADGVDAELLDMQRQELAKASKQTVYAVSAAAHTGLQELLRVVLKAVNQERKKPQPKAKKTIKTYSFADDPDAWWVEKQGGSYVVRGPKIEGFARRTNYAKAEGLERLRNILHKQGIDRELVRLGIKLGDSVEIAGKKFTW